MRQDRIIPAGIALSAVLAATLAGSHYSPARPHTAAWYASLRKPSYTPPGPVIGVAWAALDGLLAYSGYRLLLRRNRPGSVVALAAWSATLSGLTAYPAAFFGARSTAGGLATSTGMCAAAITTAVASSRVDRQASTAMLPLALWTAFATLLSEEMWRRN